MQAIRRKLVVDEDGNPLEVVIRWQDFLEIQEILGLDLDETARAQLLEARRDREEGRDGAYLELNAI